MRAVRALGPGALEVVDVPEPAPDPGVQVKTLTVGICGTDVKILEGAIPVDYPRTLGHEAVGEVMSAPTGSRFSAGDRVLVDPAISCGVCVMCRMGRTNICLVGGLAGRDADGVFAEYVVVPEARLTRVPTGLSDTAAGLLQVLGTCVHAVKSIETSPGQVAAVIGLGVGGQLISQLLTRSGLTVVGVTRSAWKRAVADEAGIAATTDLAGAETLLADITSGLGPQIVVEAVGKEETLARAIGSVATGGQVLVFGTLTVAKKGLPYYDLYHKEVTLFNPRAAVMSDYEEGVQLAESGALRLDPLVTDQLPLDRAAKAFARVSEPDSLKVLMTTSNLR